MNTIIEKHLKSEYSVTLDTKARADADLSAREALVSAIIYVDIDRQPAIITCETTGRKYRIQRA